MECLPPIPTKRMSRSLLTNLPQPTVAVGYMKKNLNSAYGGSLSDTFDREALHMTRTFMTDDHKGAAQAFVEKRAPEFKGS